MVVYFHRNPVTYEIFYVGIASEEKLLKRPYTKSHRNKYWHHTVAKYGKPVVQIVLKGLSKDVACDRERFYIALLGKKIEGGQLVNMSDGGETNAGTRHGAEFKKGCSDRAKERGMFYLQTKDARAKANISISIALKGKLVGSKNPNFGNRWTDEMKKALSEKLIKKYEHLPKKDTTYKRMDPIIARENIYNGMVEAWGRKVICTETGAIYKTIKAASDSIGMKKDTLRYKLNGVNPNNTTLKYL